MAFLNNNNGSAGSSSMSTSATSESTAASSTCTASASIEGESVLEPEIPRLYLTRHNTEEEEDDDDDDKSLQEAEDADEYDDDEGDAAKGRNSRLTSSSSSLTLSALSSKTFNANDLSLRIPREPAYGDDNADGDDDGNEEDIEDGDEYDDDDDLYDQLFDSHDPASRKAALQHASALFAQSHHNHQAYHSSSLVRRSNSTASNKSLSGAGGDEMDEVEKSFLRCTKPICSKKQLVSCLSSRSTSPGPISPLLSDEDFGCISTATSSTSNGSLPPLYSGSSTAPSSRRSSDGGGGSHTPRVRFKKGCVITAVNLTWAPTTYDRAPIDVAESLDMHRCKNVEDAEGYAQDDDEGHCNVIVLPEYNEETRGEWQAFAPGIYNASDLPNDLLPRGPPSPPAPSSPADVKFAYVSTFGATLSPAAARRIVAPEESPSSSDCQSGFVFQRSTVGYPLSRQCFERTSSSSSSSSESENDDIIERCRSFRDLNGNNNNTTTTTTKSSTTTNSTIYRPSARSPVRHSIVSSTATVETSLGAAARELSDSLTDEYSSRSSSPSLYYAGSDDCLSSTPRPGDGASFMSGSNGAARRDLYINSCVAARQANFDANGTHDTSPPPAEDQPARKMQRRLERRSSSSCSASRFTSSGDIWESCEALGGF